MKKQLTDLAAELERVSDRAAEDFQRFSNERNLLVQKLEEWKAAATKLKTRYANRKLEGGPRPNADEKDIVSVTEGGPEREAAIAKLEGQIKDLRAQLVSQEQELGLAMKTVIVKEEQDQVRAPPHSTVLQKIRI